MTSRRLLATRSASRALLAVLVGLALAMPVRAAFAWYSGGGTGSGTATTGTLLAAEVTAIEVTPSHLLLPGDMGAVAFTVANPNEHDVVLVSVTQSVDPETHELLPVSLVGDADCTVENAGITFTDQTGLSITVPAGATAFTVDLPDAVAMSVDSADACQGVGVRIPVTLTVRLG